MGDTVADLYVWTRAVPSFCGGGGGLGGASCHPQFTRHARDLFIIYDEAANYTEPM
jgi:hypothetical protein